MEINQKQKISKSLIMTPQIKMAINFLSLSRLELIDKISEEIENNPILEYSKDMLESHNYDNDKLYQINNFCSLGNASNLYLNYNFKYNDNYCSSVSEPRRIKDISHLNTNISSKETLNDYLNKQLIFTSLTEKEKKIASFIIGNLSKNGYLKLLMPELIKLTGERNNIIKKILKEIKSLDPAGICALNLKECLLIQAKRISNKNKLVEKIISNNFIDFKYRRYALISESLGVKLQDVYNAINIISHFDPNPGLRFNHCITEYIIPDLYIYENNGVPIIKFDDMAFPKLRINLKYIKAIRNTNFDISTKKYIRDRMHSAVLITKSINQRQKTIYRVMESILQFQKKFFNKGHSYLKPMSLRRVANDIGVHESTVSRAIKNKYVSTYRGIFGLKYFFDHSIKCLNGGFLASTNIQNKIKKIIKNENSLNPYSDRKITEILRTKNINIARRTVSKYRKEMGIMTSKMRKIYL